jgi:hypothetical protein
MAEILGSEVVLGLVSPSSVSSSYVLFGLGASWGTRDVTMPLLVRGGTYEILPGPLKERSALFLEEVASCGQLIENLASKTSLKPRKNRTSRNIQEKAWQLAKLSANPEALPEI